MRIFEIESMDNHCKIWFSSNKSEIWNYMSIQSGEHASKTHKKAVLLLKNQKREHKDALFRKTKKNVIETSKVGAVALT